MDLTSFLKEPDATFLNLPDEKLSPGMRQFVAVKKQHPDCVVLFRMGDFYETFYDDAKLVSKELDIVLTARGSGERRAPLAGIPYHSLEPNLAKLVKNGHKVAIVEQLEDPKLAKGLVKRGVVRIVTPGMVMEQSMLDEKSNNYIMSLYTHDERCAAAFCDISTGEFLASAFKIDQLVSMLARFSPAECIMPKSLAVNTDILALLGQHKTVVNTLDDQLFHAEKCKSQLVQHFKVHNLHGFGIEQEMIQSAGALLAHIIDTQKTNLSHISSIKVITTDEMMMLDASTMRNLELNQNMHDQTQKGTLISVIDKTQTPMGARLIRKWLKEPLRSVEKMNERFDAVEQLKGNSLERAELTALLKNIFDIERLISRITYGNAHARDLIGLKKSLEPIPKIKELLPDKGILGVIKSMSSMNEMMDIIGRAILEDAPLSVREGGMIKRGYDAELDKMHDAQKNGKNIIASIEEQEKAKTGIKNLRVRFTSVFGYFIEVSKSNIGKVPAHYIRRQTTVNGERYIIPELKEQEDLILHAEERIAAREFELFQNICRKAAEKTEQIQHCAQQIAVLDVVCSFAVVAASLRYARPVVDDSCVIDIKNGRHPVIEQSEPNFVPNDIHMKNNELVVITGPNMSGKSSVMRQVVLIVILSHMGSFVPADSARIGLVDRIFTRVGAADDLASGQSTFMVEMTETANILHNATDKSLIILDEIGRGTSTFDGLSIAWSVAEHIAQKVKAKTLFATHYHVLNKLAETHPNVRNVTVAVKEEGDEIIFLHKMIEGSTDKSYGIHVARLAGMPQSVVERAVEIQKKLEQEDSKVAKIK